MIASVSAPAASEYKKQGTEKSVYDRRDSGKCFCRQPDDPYQFISFFGILRQINSGKDSKRYRDQQRHYRHDQRIDDGWQHGSVIRGIFPGKQRRLQIRYSFDQDIGDQKQQNHKGGQCGKHYQKKQKERAGMSPV